MTEQLFKTGDRVRLVADDLRLRELGMPRSFQERIKAKMNPVGVVSIYDPDPDPEEADPFDYCVSFPLGNSGRTIGIWVGERDLAKEED